MQDSVWNYGKSFELGAGQPLLSMRLLSLFFPEVVANDCAHNSTEETAEVFQNANVILSILRAS